MDKMKILVVDDELDICAILKFNLEKAGFEVSTAQSAEDALEKGMNSYDLLLLDVMMEGMSGFDLAKMLKQKPQTKDIPIIFITAKDTADDAVNGLDLGADDYISKPFSIKEVISRVKAVLRRTSSDSASGGIEIDDEKKSVKVDGRPVSLSRTEYDLLKLLAHNPGKVFSRSDLISAIWPANVIVTERTVDVSITRLRKKIGEYGEKIVSRHGFGYCFE
ncbi:MAG: response regulator transcription factor [Candidatus Cryptobacteroides sp.]|jgi:DNA-binding response OmpR family regulator|nr:response regulator transcription factor [Bacteroidales bacterium]MEE3391255.1 response regulator transcription factor [Candidatus Cryptobacteroides sp.]